MVSNPLCAEFFSRTNICIETKLNAELCKSGNVCSKVFSCKAE